MVERAKSVNPSVLRWARERAGLTIDAVAASMKKPANVIVGWEGGEDFPTYVQLETLATKLYKRPVALFFFPEPPDEPTLTAEFRTLPAATVEALEPGTRFAIREARGFQESLRELEPEPLSRVILADVTATPADDRTHLAALVRSYLDITVDQVRELRSADDAFKLWRSSLESVGIYVFKGSIKQQSVSGFCLWDQTYPVVYINNGTPFTRQSFTLFHELAHLLFRTSGITTENADYLADLRGESRRIEIACNEFAAACLIPPDDFEIRTAGVDVDEMQISSLARVYHVSREAVARRFLDRGRLPRARYEELVAEWNQARSRTGGGGNYYATQASYLGDRFLNIAFSNYHDGRITLSELAGHLGVKAKNVERLQDFVLARQQ